MSEKRGPAEMLRLEVCRELRLVGVEVRFASGAEARDGICRKCRGREVESRGSAKVTSGSLREMLTWGGMVARSVVLSGQGFCQG